MSSGKCAFGQFWGTGGDKCIFIYIRNSEMLSYPTLTYRNVAIPLLNMKKMAFWQFTPK
jgi:hypothetical protein